MKKFKFLLRLLSLGSFSMVLSACYGVVIEAMYGVRMALVSLVTNNENTPIPDIEVTYKSDLQVISKQTNSAGYVEFPSVVEFESGASMDFKDIDGEANGSFLDKSIPLHKEEDFNNVIEAKLDDTESSI